MCSPHTDSFKLETNYKQNLIGKKYSIMESNVSILGKVPNKFFAETKDFLKNNKMSQAPISSVIIIMISVTHIEIASVVGF